MKTVRFILLLVAFSSFCAKGELLNRYFKHIDRAEKYFWNAVCNVPKRDNIRNREIFQHVSNDLYNARELAVQIEKRLPRNYRMSGGDKLAHVTQELRFLFENLLDHSVNKFTIINLQLTSVRAYANPPMRNTGNLQNPFIWNPPPGRITPFTVNVNTYRDWLEAIRRHYNNFPPFQLPRPNYRGFSKKRVRRLETARAKDYEKANQAALDFLDIMIRLRVVSVQLRQQHRYISAK